MRETKWVRRGRVNTRSCDKHYHLTRLLALNPSSLSKWQLVASQLIAVAPRRVLQPHTRNLSLALNQPRPGRSVRSLVPPPRYMIHPSRHYYLPLLLSHSLSPRRGNKCHFSPKMNVKLTSKLLFAVDAAQTERFMRTLQSSLALKGHAVELSR